MHPRTVVTKGKKSQHGLGWKEPQTPSSSSPWVALGRQGHLLPDQVAHNRIQAGHEQFQGWDRRGNYSSL